MFAAIQTNGATHIVIHVPHEGSDKSLPALARLLEQNATFIRHGYSETAIIKPLMFIELGDKLMLKEGADQEIIIKESFSVVDATFVNATPEVLISNAKAIKKERDENLRIRTELSFVRGQLEACKAQIEELNNMVVA